MGENAPFAYEIVAQILFGFEEWDEYVLERRASYCGGRWWVPRRAYCAPQDDKKHILGLHFRDKVTERGIRMVIGGSYPLLL